MVCDFRVKYNPKVDTPADITFRILYVLFVKRMKGKKSPIAFISGDSGEGKSYAALLIQVLLALAQGYDIRKVLDYQNVFTPLEYPHKVNALLKQKDVPKELVKDLKKANVFAVHEAREVVKAKNWQSFLTQAIADVNAMSRAIKPITFLIVSQFIRDITTDVRYTLTYYIKASRPIGKKTRLYVSILWKDDRDLQKPALRKRKLYGYLVYPDGRHRAISPKYLELDLPPKDIAQAFDRLDTESKTKLIQRKLNKLIKEMKQDLDADNAKLKAMVDFHIKHPDQLQHIGKRYKKGFKVNKDFVQRYDLTDNEKYEFQELLTEALEKKGVIQSE